jgi:hypothetical protein
MLHKRIKKAGQFLLDADDRTQRLFKPYAHSRLVEALGVLSKVGDQPELRVISGSLMLAGTFVGNNRLVRAAPA